MSTRGGGASAFSAPGILESVHDGGKEHLHPAVTTGAQHHGKEANVS